MQNFSHVKNHLGISHKKNFQKKIINVVVKLSKISMLKKITKKFFFWD